LNIDPTTESSDGLQFKAKTEFPEPVAAMVGGGCLRRRALQIEAA
jgi:hypothetical protein